MSVPPIRNYRIIYDPELDPNQIKQSAKPILDYEQQQQNMAKDPRPLKEEYPLKNRLYTKWFNVIHFNKNADSNVAITIDSKDKTILLSNISPLSTESQIMTILSVYGKVNHIQVIKDPTTGGPLGLAKITFDDKEAALRAIQNGNRRRVLISEAMKIEYCDSKGEGLEAALLSPIEKIPDLPISAVEKESGGGRETAVMDNYIKHKRFANEPDYNRHADPMLEETRVAKQPSRWGRPIVDPMQQRGYLDYTRSSNSRPDVYRERRNIPIPPPSPQKSYTKAVISRKYLPFVRGAIEELERLLYPFGYIDIYHDAQDWFIIFESKHSAIQAQKAIYDTNQHVLGYSIEMTILPPTFIANTSNAASDYYDPYQHHQQHPLPPFPPRDTHYTRQSYPLQQEGSLSAYNPPTRPTEQDIATSSKQLLFEELANIFLKDVKARIARPYIYDFLNPALMKKSAAESSTAALLPSPSPFKFEAKPISVTGTAAATLESNIVTSSLAQKKNNEDSSTFTSVYKLPRFKRKSSPAVTVPTIKASDLTLVPNRDQRTEKNEEEDVDISRTSTVSPSPPAFGNKRKSIKQRIYQNDNSSDGDDGDSISKSNNISSSSSSGGGGSGSSSSDDNMSSHTSIRPQKKKLTQSASSSRRSSLKITDDSSGDENNNIRVLQKKKRRKSSTATSESSSHKELSPPSSTMKKKQKPIPLQKLVKSDPKKRKNITVSTIPKKKKTSRNNSTNVINRVIEESPTKRSFNNGSNNSTLISVDSPTAMDIDIDIEEDGDTEIQDRLLPKEEIIRTIISSRRNSATASEQQYSYVSNGSGRKRVTTQEQEGEEELQQEQFDQKTLENILWNLDKPDIEEEGWFKEPQLDLDDILKPEWDPMYQTKDVEDLDYLRAAIIEKIDPGHPNKVVAALEKLERNEKRMSQSARTRRYSPIPDSVKATYLPRNKAVFEPAAINTDDHKPPSLATTVASSSSNSFNRVNNRRRCVASMVVVLSNKSTTESDVLKYQQLKEHKKQLILGKSPIHVWGVFAKEHIKANEMVMEYTGEVIRQQVAEIRERKYENRREVESGYLFRLDDDGVLDATHKGGLARFINHCCAPNCSAKIITVDQQKKVVIYANKDIESGEEITYDYKFPLETDKIICLCGSKFCKGTLN